MPLLDRALISPWYYICIAIAIEPFYWFILIYFFLYDIIAFWYFIDDTSFDRDFSYLFSLFIYQLSFSLLCHLLFIDYYAIDYSFDFIFFAFYFLITLAIIFLSLSFQLLAFIDAYAAYSLHYFMMLIISDVIIYWYIADDDAFLFVYLFSAPWLSYYYL